MTTAYALSMFLKHDWLGTLGWCLNNGPTTGVASGCIGCTCTPRAEKNGAKCTGESCKCTPRQRNSTNFEFFCWVREIWRVGVVNLVVALACVLRSTTKRKLKKVAVFFKEKNAPPEKIWLCLWAQLSSGNENSRPTHN